MPFGKDTWKVACPASRETCAIAISLLEGDTRIAQLTHIVSATMFNPTHELKIGYFEGGVWSGDLAWILGLNLSVG
jgi:hypothetical protein